VLFGIVGWIVGTLGYWHISGYRATLLDCAYMTFITVASIGFAVPLLDPYVGTALASGG